MQQRDDDACPRAADGMTERDGAAAHIHFCRVKVQQLVVGQADNSKRLVDLVQLRRQSIVP